jgi:predicted transcriptional regulator
MKLGGNLSKREHQIMDLAYERGSISSGELEDLLPGSPSNSAHTEENGRFTYRPTQPRDAVAKGEIRRLLSTFFGGSVTAAVSTLLDQERDQLSPSDIAELRKMIDEAAKKPPAS